MSDVPHAPGRMVTPSVRLVSQLGQGGMGSVWIAEHLTLKTRVVVKFISSALARDPLNVARFSREASAASQVKSPHVVQTFDHGVDDEGTPFIVMELLEGEDLGKLLDRKKKLSPREVVHVIGQVAKALSRAHEKGIVHRDIKPDNIFLCDAGADDVFVKVLDFGIAKGRDSVDGKDGVTTVTGAMVGTPFYMSPEQIVGAKEIDARTDVWSLGVMTFEMLTGTRPFQGETIGALTLSIYSSLFPRPRAVDTSLPEAIDAWFQKACARDVKERFASVRDLAHGLAEALGLPSTVDGLRASTDPGKTTIGVAANPMALALEKTAVAGSETIPRPITDVGVASAARKPTASTPWAWILAIAAILGLGGFIVWKQVSTGTSTPSAAAPESTPAKSQPTIVPTAPSVASTAVVIATTAALSKEPAPTPSVSASTSIAASASIKKPWTGKPLVSPTSTKTIDENYDIK